MDVDRRAHDPFAPTPRSEKSAKVVEENRESANVIVFEDLYKTDLVKMAERHGLPTYGNKQDLIDRLRSVRPVRS